MNFFVQIFFALTSSRLCFLANPLTFLAFKCITSLFFQNLSEVSKFLMRCEGKSNSNLTIVFPGALLSPFLSEPIYLSSIVVGKDPSLGSDKNNEKCQTDALERAFWGRMKPLESTSFPGHYHFHKVRATSTMFLLFCNLHMPFFYILPQPNLILGSVPPSQIARASNPAKSILSG